MAEEFEMTDTQKTEVRMIVIDILRGVAKELDERAEHQYKLGNVEAGLALTHAACSILWQRA